MAIMINCLLFYVWVCNTGVCQHTYRDRGTQTAQMHRRTHRETRRGTHRGTHTHRDPHPPTHPPTHTHTHTQYHSTRTRSCSLTFFLVAEIVVGPGPQQHNPLAILPPSAHASPIFGPGGAQPNPPGTLYASGKWPEQHESPTGQLVHP